MAAGRVVTVPLSTSATATIWRCPRAALADSRTGGQGAGGRLEARDDSGAGDGRGGGRTFEAPPLLPTLGQADC
jgi:hypothetical protein